MILVNIFLEKKNIDKNRDSLVVNDLQFNKKDLLITSASFN